MQLTKRLGSVTPCCLVANSPYACTFAQVNVFALRGSYVVANAQDWDDWMHVAHATLPPSWYKPVAIRLRSPLVLRTGECVQMAAIVSPARTDPGVHSNAGDGHNGEALSQQGSRREDHSTVQGDAGAVAGSMAPICELLGCKAVKSVACITCEPQSAWRHLSRSTPVHGDDALQCE